MKARRKDKKIYFLLKGTGDKNISRVKVNEEKKDDFIKQGYKVYKTIEVKWV